MNAVVGLSIISFIIAMWLIVTTVCLFRYCHMRERVAEIESSTIFIELYKQATSTRN